MELAEAQTQYEKQQVRIGQLEEAIRKQKRWVEQVQTAHSQLTREKTGFGNPPRAAGPQTIRRKNSVEAGFFLHGTGR